MATTYFMRAFKTSIPQQYVYWESVNTPDSTGTSSGYSPLELSNIVINSVNSTGSGGGGGSGSVTRIYAGGIYNPTTNDEYIIIISLNANLLINLPGTPPDGFSLKIKDSSGFAADFPITIDSGAVGIDNQFSYTFNKNYGALELVYNGTYWNVF